MKDLFFESVLERIYIFETRWLLICQIKKTPKFELIANE